MTGQPAYTDADAPTLTEFLLARRAEALDDKLIADAAWEATRAGFDASESAEWLRLYGESFSAQSTRLAFALGDLGWSVVGGVWPSALRREAAKYAEHPDYRDEWRP